TPYPRLQPDVRQLQPGVEHWRLPVRRYPAAVPVHRHQVYSWWPSSPRQALGRCGGAGMECAVTGALPHLSGAAGGEMTSTARLVTRLLLLVAVMFGFGFALVPLYDVMCQAFGINGKTAGQYQGTQQVD